MNNNVVVLSPHSISCSRCIINRATHLDDDMLTICIEKVERQEVLCFRNAPKIGRWFFFFFCAKRHPQMKGIPYVWYKRKQSSWPFLHCIQSTVLAVFPKWQAQLTRGSVCCSLPLGVWEAFWQLFQTDTLEFITRIVMEIWVFWLIFELEHDNFLTGFVEFYKPGKVLLND